MSTAEFHELTIASVQPQSEGAVSLAFSLPPKLQAVYRFTAGQYLTLRADIDGEDVRRSYSICSAVQQTDLLEVGIRSVPDGVFSNYAMGLSAGDEVRVMTPQGRFTAELGGVHRYLLLAVGSGITPCLSIAKSVLQGEPDSRITLVYGNRTSATMMFRDDILALKDSYIERFRLINVMSGEKQEAAVLNGRIDEQKLIGLSELGMLSAEKYDGCYICGPQQMMAQTSSALEALGVDKKRIHIELFATAGSKARPGTSSRRPAADNEDDTGIAVSLLHDGVKREIKVNPDTDTVLTAAQRAGLDLPFSCAGGMCSTCRCKVVSGQTLMDINYSLAEWEIEAGYTLACQTRPVAEPVELDFDAS